MELLFLLLAGSGVAVIFGSICAGCISCKSKSGDTVSKGEVRKKISLKNNKTKKQQVSNEQSLKRNQFPRRKTKSQALTISTKNNISTSFKNLEIKQELPNTYESFIVEVSNLKAEDFTTVDQAVQCDEFDIEEHSPFDGWQTQGDFIVPSDGGMILPSAYVVGSYGDNYVLNPALHFPINGFMHSTTKLKKPSFTAITIPSSVDENENTVQQEYFHAHNMEGTPLYDDYRNYQEKSDTHPNDTYFPMPPPSFDATCPPGVYQSMNANAHSQGYYFQHRAQSPTPLCRDTLPHADRRIRSHVDSDSLHDHHNESRKVLSKDIVMSRTNIARINRNTGRKEASPRSFRKRRSRWSNCYRTTTDAAESAISDESSQCWEDRRERHFPKYQQIPRNDSYHSSKAKPSVKHNKLRQAGRTCSATIDRDINRLKTHRLSEDLATLPLNRHRMLITHATASQFNSETDVDVENDSLHSSNNSYHNEMHRSRIPYKKHMDELSNYSDLNRYHNPIIQQNDPADRNHHSYATVGCPTYPTKMNTTRINIDTRCSHNYSRYPSISRNLTDPYSAFIEVDNFKRMERLQNDGVEKTTDYPLKRRDSKYSQISSRIQDSINFKQPEVVSQNCILTCTNEMMRQQANSLQEGRHGSVESTCSLSEFNDRRFLHENKSGPEHPRILDFAPVPMESSEFVNSEIPGTYQNSRYKPEYGNNQPIITRNRTPSLVTYDYGKMDDGLRSDSEVAVSENHVNASAVQNKDSSSNSRWVPFNKSKLEVYKQEGHTLVCADMISLMNHKLFRKCREMHA